MSENPRLIGEARPLWRDYSYYNGTINAQIAAANGVQGAFMRAGISWGYIDPLFAENWQKFQEAGLYRSSYHVLYTDQPVLRQLDEVWYRVHPQRDIIPRMIDLEVDRGDDPGHKAEAVWEASEIIKQRDGVRPLIYSRYLLINSWLTSWTEEMLNEHYWVLAQYLSDPTREHPGPPTLPDRVRRERVVLHQTADTLPGFPGEAESKAVDRDRWELGDVEQMKAFIQINWGAGAPPETPKMKPFSATVSIIIAPDTKFIETLPIADGQALELQSAALWSAAPLKANAVHIAGGVNVLRMGFIPLDGNFPLPVAMTLFPGDALRVNLAEAREGTEVRLSYAGVLLPAV